MPNNLLSGVRQAGTGNPATMVYAQTVDAYRKYSTFDSDTDKTDWDLCLFYLADYHGTTLNSSHC